MIYPLVTDLYKDGIPILVTCGVLNLNRSAYYRWKQNPITSRDLLQATRINVLHNAHQNDPEFSYRYLRDEAFKTGTVMSVRTAWKLCNNMSWFSCFGKKPGHVGRRPGPAVHDDLLQRKFRTKGLNTVWLTDITEHPTRTGKLYLCAIKDLASNKIVGYSMNTRMTAELAVNALNNALTTRGKVTGCIIHSDRGSQFRSKLFTDALKTNGLIGSMGRVAACADNAAMESFFSLLQKNVLNRRTWDYPDQLRVAIFYWIEQTYHGRRKQERLGRLTPIEYETIIKTVTKQVA